MKRCLATVSLIACVLAAPLAHGDTPVSATARARDRALDLLVDEPRPTSAGGERGPAVERRSLDTELVLTIVRERLEHASARLAAEALGTLGGQAARPWARDLLTTVGRLALAPADGRRGHVEASLRIAARMLIADVAVRHRHLDWRGLPAGGSEPERRAHLTDWVYWRLGTLPPLEGAASMPDCARAGAVRPLCDELAGDEAARIATLDRVVGAARLFAALTAVEALATDGANPRAARRVVEALVRFDDGTTAQVDAALAAIDVDVAGLVKALATFSTWWDRTRAAARALYPHLLEARAIGTLTPATAAAVQAFARAAYFDVEAPEVAAVDTAIRRLITDAAQATPPYLRPAMTAFLDRVERVRSYAAAWRARPDERAILAGLTDQVMADLDGLADLAISGRLLTAVRADVAAIITALRRVDLRRLDGEALDALARSLAVARADFDALARTLRGVGGVEVAALRDAHVATGRLAAAIAVAADVVRALGSGTFTDALAAMHSLGSVAGVDFDASVLTRLAPLARLLDARGPLRPGALYALIASQDPRRLAADLGLDLAACERADGTMVDTWPCWAGRLLLGLHGALAVEGDRVTLDAAPIVTELTRYGADRRRARLRTPYLHLAVGGGVLYRPGMDGAPARTPPLIAEQIGVGMTLHRVGPLSLRAALFGSGLLYRFVLDSRESDGVMVGGGVMLGLYDEVELFGGAALLLDASDDGSDGVARGVFLFGAQVPLSAYLERL